MIIKNLLYNKDVELQFESFKHQYKIGGKIIPSVTTALGIIAKPQLINWAAGMCADYIGENWEPGKSYDELEIQTIVENGRKAHYQKKLDAGFTGTFVHKLVESYIKGDKVEMPINKSLKLSYQAFLDWVKEHDVKFLLSEQQVYSRKHDYTGTLDFVCKIDGKMYIGDLKTSKAIYKAEYGSQLAAYKLAREEEFPDEKYAGCLLIRIGKENADFEFWQFEDDTLYRETFLSALNLYKNTEKIKQLEKG